MPRLRRWPPFGPRCRAVAASATWIRAPAEAYRSESGERNEWPPIGSSRTDGSRFRRLASRAAVTARSSSAFCTRAHAVSTAIKPDRVGLSPFAGIGVFLREPIDLVKLAFRKALRVQNRLVAEQLQVEHRDIEQDVVRGRLGAERAPASRCRAASGSNQASVKGLKMFTPGMLTVPPHRLGTGTEVQRLLRDIDHLAGGPLEDAVMAVVAGAGVERWQQERPGRQLKGECLENHGSRGPDRRVGHVGQP